MNANRKFLVNGTPNPSSPFTNRVTPTLLMASALLTAPLAWSDAVLHDGTVLTPTAEAFATEGAIWDLNLASQQITVVGKTLTIANTIDGAPLLISGSSVLGKDGEAATGIGAASFDRLSDANAVGRDVTVDRCGAARSIFSTTEGRNRDPATQAQIEANYFAMVEAAYDQHPPGALPADFLQRAGIGRDSDGDGIADSNVYPVTAGGTLKSAGHVYSGNHFITDVETVLELSENVSGGPVTSVSRGLTATLGIDGQCAPGFVPPSFVIGELLIIFNQDPRFGADVLGLGEAPIPREIFFDQFELNPGIAIDTIGHLVGEHVMFVQEVLTEFTDPTAGIQITSDRYRYDTDKAELRFRGTVDKAEGIDLVARLMSFGMEVVLIDIDLAIDPLTGAATYSLRERGLPNFDTIIMEARTTGTSDVLASESIVLAEVL